MKETFSPRTSESVKNAKNAENDERAENAESSQKLKPCFFCLLAFFKFPGIFSRNKPENLSRVGSICSGMAQNVLSCNWQLLLRHKFMDVLLCNTFSSALPLLGGGKRVGGGVVMKSMIKCRLYLISPQLLIELG
jgi:hypothetical protein